MARSGGFGKALALSEFALLANVIRLNGTVITHDAGPHLAGGTLRIFQLQIVPINSLKKPPESEHYTSMLDVDIVEDLPEAQPVRAVVILLGVGLLHNLEAIGMRLKLDPVHAEHTARPL